MTSEVIVDVQPKEISIALLEDKRLVEFQKEGREASFVVGNIYLAKVRKLMPGLNACFVNVGYERDAFLHYLDLGPKFNSYTKYLKQVTSDKKKLYPIAKASNLPDLEKEGSVQTTLQQRVVENQANGIIFKMFTLSLKITFHLTQKEVIIHETKASISTH